MLYTMSPGELVWAITGVSGNTDYICRYQPNKVKCNCITLGKFKGLLFLLGQTETSQRRRVTSEVKSKLPVLCFCESKYNTRAPSAKEVGSAGQPPVPPNCSPSASPLGVVAWRDPAGEVASFLPDRWRGWPSPRGGERAQGASHLAFEVGKFQSSAGPQQSANGLTLAKPTTHPSSPRGIQSLPKPPRRRGCVFLWAGTEPAHLCAVTEAT